MQKVKKAMQKENQKFVHIFDKYIFEFSIIYLDKKKEFSLKVNTTQTHTMIQRWILALRITNVNARKIFIESPRRRFVQQTIKSHISKFAEINRRYNFSITIQQLLRDDNICCFTRMIGIPKHILIPFFAQTRSRSARYYTRILSSITATSLCGSFEPFKV